MWTLSGEGGYLTVQVGEATGVCVSLSVARNGGSEVGMGWHDRWVPRAFIPILVQLCSNCKGP